MSEADKLFEELGYKKWIDSRNITHFIHKKKEKDFTFMNGNCYSIKRPTKKEQIAINKKVEELRMDMSNKTSDKNVAKVEEERDHWHGCFIVAMENGITKEKVKNVLKNNRNEIFSATYLSREQFRPYEMQIERINKIEQELLEGEK